MSGYGHEPWDLGGPGWEFVGTNFGRGAVLAAVRRTLGMQADDEQGPAGPE